MTEEREKTILGPYRVLELPGAWSCFCGKILGDLGADTIKIEPPGGDPARNIGPFYQDMVDPEKSLFWWAYNTSKRSITLDLEKADGREIFKKLVKQADILIESFPPGYMENLGLDYSVLSDINPDLVMTAISPHGQTGPYADYKMTDLIAQAMAGIVWISGDADRPPVRVTYEPSYAQASVLAAVGTLTALFHRVMGGEGQYVDVSIREADIPLTHMTRQLYEAKRYVVKRDGCRMDAGQSKLGGARPINMLYPCSDGYIHGTTVGGSDSKPIVAWMNEEGLALDLANERWMKPGEPSPRLGEVTPEMRQRNYDEISQKFLRNKTKRQIHEEAVKRKIWWFAVQSPLEVTKDRHFIERGYWQEVYHPELDATVKYLGPFITFGEAPWKIWRRPPLIGEHNHEVYEDELKIPRDRLANLKQCGAI